MKHMFLIKHVRPAYAAASLNMKLIKKNVLAVHCVRRRVLYHVSVEKSENHMKLNRINVSNAAHATRLVSSTLLRRAKEINL